MGVSDALIWVLLDVFSLRISVLVHANNDNYLYQVVRKPILFMCRECSLLHQFSG